MRSSTFHSSILILACILAMNLDSIHALNVCNRRQWITSSLAAATSLVLPPQQGAFGEDSESYMPPGPEERSGLVVLRVAEVCDFQEKILRAIVKGDIDTVVSPQQIVFGTQVLLRNSNIAGNMKLMIDTEIPPTKRDKAVTDAVNTMNKLQDISTTAAKILRPFTNDEMIEIADMYRDVRLRLNNMYEYLEQKEKDKYYGYFMKVTEYEKKIADGVYNPELDGVLKLEY